MIENSTKNEQKSRTFEKRAKKSKNEETSMIFPKMRDLFIKSKQKTETEKSKIS